MDNIQISKLRIETRIGIHAWEQKILQTLLLDIYIPLDLSICKNDLNNTIDYARLAEECTNYIASHAFTLLETVAEQLAKHLKNCFAINSVTICVSKPHAICNAANISVTITRYSLSNGINSVIL